MTLEQWFPRLRRMWKMIKEVVTHDLTEMMKMLNMCRMYQPSLLCRNIEAITWSCSYKKALTFAQWLDSPWQCSSSQCAVKQFLAQKSITEMEHPPYSPDLAPNDFWLLPKIKSALKGQRFQDNEDKKKNMMAFKATPQQVLQICYQQ